MKYGHVGVIGGGTAGYFVAIALKRANPARRVTVVESSKIPVIGVGEATTPPMVPFLHHVLGIDVHDFYTRVTPTWKLGIRFEWGGQPFFNYPFGPADVVGATTYEQDLVASSLTSRLMAADKFPVVDGVMGAHSLLGELRFAYHLDNKRFVAYLAEHAKRQGVEHLDRMLTDVAIAPGGGAIDHVKTAEGEDLRFDLYVDATGFRSLLLGKALGSPFESYASTLLCDRAVVADVPHDGLIRPYTTAETMDAGWCWRIPVPDCDHRGYVYSSAFLDDASAEAELLRKNPGATKTSNVKFRSGRLRDFWIGNAAAVGNAYGFVEPLESTALHVVILEALALVRALRASDNGSEPDRAKLTRDLATSWDYLRWFLGIHYRYNQRLDTPFWRECRASVDVSGLDDWLELYRSGGPLTAQGVAADARDIVFGPRGFDLMMLGQQVLGPIPAPALSALAWDQRRTRESGLVESAWPQARALGMLHKRPDLLADMVHGRGSWITAMAQDLRPLL